MDRKELSIIALNRSNSSDGNYVLVLEEKNGLRRMPIIIGPFEAQAIAIAVEDMKLPRPMTHDLTLNILERGQTQLREVVIKAIEDGIFLAELIIDSQGNTEQIDARTSDAVALALRKPCKIYTYEHVLEEAGISTEKLKSLPKKQKNLAELSKQELEKLLSKALEEEDYERAQQIQDALKKK